MASYTEEAFEYPRNAAHQCLQVWYRLKMATGVQETMTEHSLFRRVDGQWLYYDRLA